mmetsp:Transcript_10842/g.19451  ORF Transcript_10842/g.19451 Transcript_10842/m.19451 type:complete len:249 (+) Transcript_10842:147-893(+)
MKKDTRRAIQNSAVMLRQNQHHHHQLVKLQEYSSSVEPSFEESSGSLHSTVPVHPPLTSHGEKPVQHRSAAPTSTTKRKQTVRFCEVVEVRETLHINEMTDDEHELYWISHHEQDVILNMADITTELMSIGAYEDGEHICFRGLEGKTPEANQEYSDKYLNLVEAVVYEQEHSRSSAEDGSIDHERIAALYRDWTQACKDIAWYRAQLDELEARKNEHETLSYDNQDDVFSSSSSSASMMLSFPTLPS